MKIRKPWMMLAAALSILSAVCWASEETVKPIQAVGEIFSVDAAAQTLAVRMSPVSEPANFVVDSKAVISKDKQKSKLSDLKTGDLVKIEFSVTSDSKSLASSVAAETKAALTETQ